MSNCVLTRLGGNMAVSLSLSLPLSLPPSLSQTRLTDWREGGLNSKYLLAKLKEMAEEVHQYVESSAPGGWSCEWDR